MVTVLSQTIGVYFGLDVEAISMRMRNAIILGQI